MRQLVVEVKDVSIAASHGVPQHTDPMNRYVRKAGRRGGRRHSRETISNPPERY